MIVEVVNELRALEALREEWDALADRFDTPLLRSAFFLAAARTYGAGEELAVFTIRRDGRLVAAAPLVVDRSGLVPRLRPLAFQDKEPDGFLYEDEAALTALCAAVLGAGRPLVLARLDPGSPEWRVLARDAGRYGMTLLRPAANSCYRTVLAGSAAAFEAAMDSKKRSRLRRMRNGLEQHGEVTFEVTSPDEAAVDAAVEEVARVEAASWKLRSGTAMAVSPERSACMTEHARLAAREGMLRLSALRLNGETIAAQLDLEYAGRLWGQKMGADERWAKYGPGILSNHELMKWASDQGLSALEHLGFAEEWQRRWPFEAREFGAFRFYPRRATAALAFGADAAAFVTRGVRARAVARARAAEKARAA
ncbi:MAG TPA: GNAT family N-acetyltransferase [Caulobacteraceae bacterium]|jgi:CelD/BcsL family acetyltransferase involved in cellulose biosynthesis